MLSNRSSSVQIQRKPIPITVSRNGQLFMGLELMHPVTIVIISRLVYRKGIDLLVAAAPQICELYPNVRFLVGKLRSISSGMVRVEPITGGDGPKMVELEQMREKYQLQDRVTLLGSVKPFRRSIGKSARLGPYGSSRPCRPAYTTRSS